MAACGASTSGRCDALRPAFKLVRCGRRVQWSARSAPVRAEAADATSSGSGAAALQREQQLRRDPYKLAGHRLRTLLNGVGDGEEEMMNSMLEEQPPQQKLAMCLLASGLVTGGAALVCVLCGLDPLGGASLSLASLQAAAVGGAAAAPLVGLKALLWSETARRELPFLEDIHKSQVDAFKPVMANLNAAQTAVLLASEVVPGLLILLPATAGGVAKALEFYGQAAGVQLPETLPSVLALCLVAGIAGVGKVAETSVSLEEYEVVRDAVDNADRFYRLMAMDRDSTPADAARAAEAFKTVALTWMARNQVAVRFAAALGACEVLYLGCLWQQTGDLSAPLVAALGAAAVDFAFIRRMSTPVNS
ncbi:ABC transporter ATP-binding permease [Micractinium conductrix]|uniref:ABC transporter ATP-binding permease n=1 Tax=Micractinium conductrix TaxID=554055 RepID=A0A2P6V193_9CHLO|nr:ABC transporter ATP-binding permease [Micractinium conductrix]|eukprot:PSC67853.1 ABC transporter ATP-binding permease [Micractinium conductrix]